MHPTQTRRALIGATTLAALPTAQPAAAQPGPRLPFAVPPVTIPVAGTDLRFPVRRISGRAAQLRRAGGVAGRTGRRRLGVPPSRWQDGEGQAAGFWPETAGNRQGRPVAADGFEPPTKRL